MIFWGKWCKFIVSWLIRQADEITMLFLDKGEETYGTKKMESTSGRSWFEPDHDHRRLGCIRDSKGKRKHRTGERDRSDGAGRHACDDTGTDGKSGRRNSGRDRRTDRRGDSGGICDAGSERGTDGRAQYDSDGDTCSHTGSTGSHRAGLAGDRTGNPLF